MTSPDLIDMATLGAYTAEVLRFSMQGTRTIRRLPELGAADLDRHVKRVLRLVSASGKDRLVLLGLGTGVLAKRLATALPEQVRMVCCERSADRARDTGTDLESSRAVVLADTSTWAHACLPALCGFGPGSFLAVVNPELPKGRERDEHQELQRLLVKLQPADPAPPCPKGLENLTCAAILSPEEPDLSGFLSQLPADIRELCLVWDGAEIPDATRGLPFPLRQAAHPLGNDFAAQRNRLLELCSGDWVLSLDADERLPAGFWDRLPFLLARLDEAGAQGVLLPRLTLFPDQGHFRAGYGLWPDVQLRLFRRVPGLHYQRPVHERLTGLDGTLALLPDQPILHLTHLLKRPEAIREKLARFDAASQGSVSHTLNQEFPNLPVGPPYMGRPDPDRDGGPPMLLIPASGRAGNGAARMLAGNSEAV